MSDWVIGYLLGCAAAFLLVCFNSIFFWAVRWMTRTNVILRNMKKIAPPDETTFFGKVAKGVGVVVLELALSWISVLVGLWSFAKVVLESIRELFTPVPDRIRSLRFPLRNNPDLPRESVWAHGIALAVVAGQPLNQPSDLFEAFREVTENYPGFDRRAALLQLRHLHVVEEEVVNEALSQLATKRAPDSEWDDFEVGDLDLD